VKIAVCPEFFYPDRIYVFEERGRKAGSALLFLEEGRSISCKLIPPMQDSFF
jgi:hypothetical protein